MGTPDWKDAPNWAKYLAMDSNGNWYWYENKPTFNLFDDADDNLGSWYVPGKYEHITGDFICPSNSLQGRPE